VAAVPLPEVAGGVDHVAEDGAGGRRRPPPAVEQQLADRVALDEDGVEAVAHRRQRVAGRDHGRVHPHRHPPVAALLGDGEQLHHVAEPGGDGDVEGA
jgi:hypothetical protein